MTEAVANPDWWLNFVQSFHTTDHIFFIVGTWLVHFLTFWSINIFLYFAYKNNWFREQRIERRPGQLDFPPEALIKECLTGQAVSHFIVQPIMMYFAYDLYYSFGLRVSAPLPSVGIIVRDFAVFIAINDTLFYWFHRMLHHPSIYKYIHKKHHRFNYSIGIASEFAHPVEDALANNIPTLLGPLLMGSHCFTLWLWLFIRIWETIDAHSGYSFEWHPLKLLPFGGGPDRHDFHHSHNTGCYGSFTNFWDHICGTDQTFKEYQREKAERKQKILAAQSKSQKKSN